MITVTKSSNLTNNISKILLVTWSRIWIAWVRDRSPPRRSPCACWTFCPCRCTPCRCCTACWMASSRAAQTVCKFYDFFFYFQDSLQPVPLPLGPGDFRGVEIRRIVFLKKEISFDFRNKENNLIIPGRLYARFPSWLTSWSSPNWIRCLKLENFSRIWKNTTIR